MKAARQLQLPILLVSLLITTSPWARWEYHTFKSGSLKHWIAATAPDKNNRELELFCSNNDSRPSLALYLPDQRFLKRESVEIEVQVDQERVWKLQAFRHAMAITSLDTPDALLTQLAAGNNVRVTYPTATTNQQTNSFSLSRSARAIKKMKAICKG